MPNVDISDVRETVGFLPLNSETVFHTLTNYGSGVRSYIRVFIAKGSEIVEITYWVKGLTGAKRIEPGKGIPRNGGNTNLALEVIDDMWRTLKTAGFDFGYSQDKNWREI